MNEQPTYAPSPWRARWYRFLRLCSRVYRRPQTDIGQALRTMLRRGYRRGRQAGYIKGHEDGVREGVALAAKYRPSLLICQYHHDTPLYCPLCTPFLFRAQTWMPEPAEPHTDPQQHLQITIPQQRPLHVYRQAVKDGAGTSTATLAAIPKWLVRLREKPKEGKDG